MKIEKALMQRVVDFMELPGEPLPGNTVIELLGAGRVLIDGHRGIIHYSKEKIIVTVSFGRMEILGEEMELTSMTGRQVIITGRICGISLLRGEIQ